MRKLLQPACKGLVAAACGVLLSGSAWLPAGSAVIATPVRAAPVSMPQRYCSTPGVGSGLAQVAPGRWTGWLRASADGRHTLELATTGAARIEVQREVSADLAKPMLDVALKAGRYHVIRIETESPAADGSAPGEPELWWTTPGGERQRVPVTLLFPPGITAAGTAARE